MIVSEIPSDLFKTDKTLNYKYVYLPEHELANEAGKIYEHIYVAVVNIGRLLKSDECVHHKDRDRSNNDWSNLMVLTNEEHSRLHQKEDYKHKEYTYVCKTCKETYTCRRKRVPVYCSKSCRSKGRSLISVDKEELRILVWSYPTTKVAEILGVSDSAIGKYCKKLEVEKPPRGYWRKVETNSI